MKTQIIQIGNSRGIRIPKPVLEQCGFVDQVDMQISDGQLIISNSNETRREWDKQFRSAKIYPDDGDILSHHSLNEWENNDWQW